MIGDDVDDRPDAERGGLGDQLLRFLERAEGRVDGPVVGDVVATVGQRRDGTTGVNQMASMPRRREVRKARPDAGEVADAVAVAVGEAPE